MNADVKQRMDALLSTSARLVIDVFIEELIEDAVNDFMSCSKDTFDRNKGRVEAYQRLLNYVRTRSIQ